MNTRSLPVAIVGVLLTCALTACGGDSHSTPPPAQYTIGGQVSGLSTGAQVVLSDNGSDTLTVASNGSFSFSKPVSGNGAYSVTVLTQPTGLTCTISNGTGTAVTNITNVTVACSVSTYTIGGTVSGLTSGTSVTLQNGAEALTVTVNGPFTFTTPVTYNGSYTVSVSPPAGGEFCAATNASGTAVQANVTNVQVSCSVFNEIAFVTNSAMEGESLSPTIGAYVVNPTTGALIPVGSYPTNWSPFVTVDHAGKYVYVSSQGNNADTGNPTYGSISVYTIDHTSGTLTPIQGSPLLGAGPSPPVIDPSGRFLYTYAFAGYAILAYTIDATTGALTPVTGSPFAAERDSWDIVIDPTGKFLYSADLLDNNISAYTIDSTSGSLTPSGAPFGINSHGIVIDPTGKYAFSDEWNVAVDAAYPDFLAYTIDATSGRFTLIAGSPFPGYAPTPDPTGRFFYSTSNSAVTAYAIDTVTNTLTLVSSSPLPPGNPYSSGVLLDPAGKFAYVSIGIGGTSGPAVEIYTIDATSGALTPLAGSPFTIPGAVPGAFDPSGQFLYVPSQTRLPGTVSVFAKDAATGALTPVPGSPFTVGSVPTAVTFVKVR